MATHLARQGRHRQLYEDNFRLVSGCIPYRFKNGCESCCQSIENFLEVLMISSPNRDDLVFPKGGWENDESVHDAARREAFEEAGVLGELNHTQLGIWEFRSKSTQAQTSLDGGCRGYMFSLKVTKELPTWPEQENHDRKWLSTREAFELCRYEWMREALDAFLELMKKDEQQSNQIVRDSDVTIATTAADRESTKSAFQTRPADCQVSKTTSGHKPPYKFSWDHFNFLLNLQRHE